MDLEKRYYKQLIKERLTMLVGAKYDMDFYKEEQQGELKRDVEALRKVLIAKKEELNKLIQARIAIEKSKGAMLEEDREKLKKLASEINEMECKGGEIDKLMEVKATMKAYEERFKTRWSFYKFARNKGKSILREIDSVLDKIK